ncbi:MAG: hypothetical protein AB2672_14960 [Candidatus Thiodiazotropha endolucinida]
MRYNVQRKQITNSYVEGAKYLYGDAYFSYDENGQLTYVDRGRKKGAQQNSAASFTYDNQGQIIARTEQPTAAFNPDFMRGYYVDPDHKYRTPVKILRTHPTRCMVKGNHHGQQGGCDDTRSRNLSQPGSHPLLSLHLPLRTPCLVVW